MSVLRTFEDDDYWPDFGTLVVRDTYSGEDPAGPFAQWEVQGQPCGTIARAGHGWLEGSGGDGPLVVRLELHDGVPPAETDDWYDVLETPYRSLTGVVGLTTVAGGPGDAHLPLGDVGDYRIRVATKALPASDEDPETLWALRFWPVDAPTPPRWLRRSTEPVGSGTTGWENLLRSPAIDLLPLVWWSDDDRDRSSLDAVARRGERRFGGPGWLTRPLPQEPDSDLDPAALAQRLGRPEPASAQDVLDLFVAAGVLEANDDGYRTSPTAPRAQDVLDLSAERTAKLEELYELARYRCFSSDLLVVALWGGTKQTVTALVERTLASEADVRDTLEWAHRTGLLEVEGVLTGEFTMTVPG